jgi:hypothetical protein
MLSSQFQPSSDIGFSILEEQQFVRERDEICAGNVIRWDDQLAEVTFLLARSPSMAGIPTDNPGIWALTTGYVGVTTDARITPLVIYYSFGFSGPRTGAVHLESVIVADEPE